MIVSNVPEPIAAMTAFLSSEPAVVIAWSSTSRLAYWTGLAQ